MATSVASYKPTKPEIYEAIGSALADPAMVTGGGAATADMSAIQKAVAKENPNWHKVKPSKFKKYQKRVVAAMEAGIDPKDASNLVGDDASVSTIGSIASRAKNFVIGKTSTSGGGSRSPTSPTSSITAAKHVGDDDVSDIASTSTGKTFGSIKKKLGSIKKSMKASASGPPGSIGARVFSPSPLKEDPIRGEGVEYSAVPPPILSDGTADTTPDHSDRELDLSTSAYADDNDGVKDKKDECCAQGCIIL